MVDKGWKGYYFRKDLEGEEADRICLTEGAESVAAALAQRKLYRSLPSVQEMASDIEEEDSRKRADRVHRQIREEHPTHKLVDLALWRQLDLQWRPLRIHQAFLVAQNNLEVAFTQDTRPDCVYLWLLYLKLCHRVFCRLCRIERSTTVMCCVVSRHGSRTRLYTLWLCSRLSTGR